MPTPAERQALLFLAMVTAVGLAVRGVEARRARPDPSARAALAAQLARVDSAIAARAGMSPGRGARGSSSGGAPARAVQPTPTPSPTLGSPSRSAPAPGPVDVDVADAAALEALPYIGPALAARIVEDRAAHGPFGSVEGLQRVRGIGPALAARLAGRVTFSGTPRLPSVALPARVWPSSRAPGRGRSP